DVVLDRDPFADKRVARDLTVSPDACLLLNLDEGTDLGVVTHVASVEIDEARQGDTRPQLHVGSDVSIVVHSRTARPRSFRDRSAPSSSFTTRKPATPSLMG